VHGRLREDASVTDDALLGRMARIGRAAMGERLGGFVYGTIVVLAVIVAGAKAYPEHPGHVGLLVAITTAVLWLAHVYAHGLAQGVEADERLTVAGMRRVARHEAAILEAGVPSLIALFLGSLGAFSARTAVWVALALGLVVLVAAGMVFARAERLGPFATLGVVAANLALGLLLIGMKLTVAH
jgi:hypothetical protein